jgi:hypothetical protein
LLGPADCYLGRDGQAPEEKRQPGFGLLLRAVVAASPGPGGGPLEGLFGSQAVNTRATQLADRQPRLGQALQVAAGLQYRRSRLARLDSFSEGAALQNLDFGLQDPDPGLDGGQPGRRGNLQALGQGGLGLLQVTGRIQHRPPQPVQVGA